MISLRQKHTKEVTLYVKLIIDEKNIIGRLYRYFFQTFSVPTVETLFLPVLSMLAMESADSMVREVMPVFQEKKQVILLFDSRYAKENLISVMDRFSNLDIICCASTDSVLYDLPPEPTGRRGRPTKRGKRLSIEDDFILSPEKINSYHIGARRVLTNIFGLREVMACVTCVETGGRSKRLFFSTIFPEQLKDICMWQEKVPQNRPEPRGMDGIYTIISLQPPLEQ